jgi:hypothetical protein
MRPRSRIAPILAILFLVSAVEVLAQTAKASGRAEPPAGTLTVAVATFAGERWLPHLYPGAEDLAYAAPLVAPVGPWLHEYIPGVAIGAAHNIAGLGPKVGDRPLIPGHMGFHNWEYVARAK